MNSDKESTNNPTTITIRECDSRHRGLTDWITKIESRVGTIESRFLAILVLLIVNLIGVVVILLTKK